jgi:hypothetical protein
MKRGKNEIKRGKIKTKGQLLPAPDAARIIVSDSNL